MVRKKFRKHSSKGRKPKDILTAEEIDAQIKKQEDEIESDVERAIEDFVNNGNKYHALNVLKAIEAFGDTQAGFAAWKDYALDGNGVLLTKRLRDVNVPPKKLYSLKKALKEFEQRQDETSRRSLKAFASRNIFEAFHTAAQHLRASENRGGLNDAQKAIFDTFSMTRWMFDGPNTEIHPLTSALAPYFKIAVGEKWLTSYEELKKQAGTPLIGEHIIHGVHEAVLYDARDRFRRLVEQHRETETQPMEKYGFHSSQMPKDLTFGVEFEGFTSLRAPYPKNIFELARRFKKAGLDAMASLNPRASTGYNAWNITIDGSIITPRDFKGRHKTHDLVVRDSPSMEIVSPILKGPAGHADMMKAVDGLRDVHFKSNESCGFHMHIGVKDAPPKELRNLALALFDNQIELDKLLSPERHGDENKFATSIPKNARAAIEVARTVNEVVEAINPGMDRYSKFDMTGLVLDGAPPTIQYRGAGGANYLGTVSDYTIILANFTEQALKNPEVTLDSVIRGLEAQRDKPDLTQKSAPAKKAAPKHKAPVR
jgi:hypothetical protein